ncbi:MAG TPA: hypothetical protein ENK15_06860 [Thermopetrobacter sp.]|nr:hypothetical protein [Thermopetrobacter sp.]
MLMWLMLALAATGAPAHAQSFDCRKAQAADEHAICATARLGAQDEIIATLYRRLWRYIENHDAAMGVLAQLKGEQRDFLRDRARCGANVACLDHIQRRRIVELADWYRRGFGS